MLIITIWDFGKDTMKFGFLSLWAALMLSCALPSSFTVEARHMALKHQSDLHHNQEEQRFFQDKLAATKFKVSVQYNSPAHNDAHKIKGAKTLASKGGGTQIFPRHKNAPAIRKGIAVMAFRPSSSGHSPGIGHDNPPDPTL